LQLTAFGARSLSFWSHPMPCLGGSWSAFRWAVHLMRSVPCVLDSIAIWP